MAYCVACRKKKSKEERSVASGGDRFASSRPGGVVAAAGWGRTHSPGASVRRATTSECECETNVGDAQLRALRAPRQPIRQLLTCNCWRMACNDRLAGSQLLNID